MRIRSGYLTLAAFMLCTHARSQWAHMEDSSGNAGAGQSCNPSPLDDFPPLTGKTTCRLPERLVMKHTLVILMILLVCCSGGFSQTPVPVKPLLIDSARVIESKSPMVKPGLVVTTVPDLVITKAELLVLNPGDGLYAAGRPIYTHSSTRWRIYVKNAGTAPAPLKDLSWGII